MTASVDGTAAIWSTGNGKRLASLSHDAEVADARYSPDGLQIVTTSRDKTAKVWSARTGELLLTLSHRAGVFSAAFSANGRYLVTGTMAGEASVWSVADGSLQQQFQHSGRGLQVDFIADDQQLLVAAEDGAHRWSLQSGEQLRSFPHKRQVTSARVNLSGKTLLTTAEDNTVVLWSLATGMKLEEWAGSLAEFNGSGEQALVASKTGTRFWITTIC